MQNSAKKIASQASELGNHVHSSISLKPIKPRRAVPVVSSSRQPLSQFPYSSAGYTDWRYLSLPPPSVTHSIPQLLHCHSKRDRSLVGCVLIFFRMHFCSSTRKTTNASSPSLPPSIIIGRVKLLKLTIVFDFVPFSSVVCRFSHSRTRSIVHKLASQSTGYSSSGAQFLFP